MQDSAQDTPQTTDETADRRTTQNNLANTADPNASFEGTQDTHTPGDNLYTLPEMQEQQPRNPPKPLDEKPAEPPVEAPSMLDRETHGQLLDEPAPDGTSGITDSVLRPITAQASNTDDNNRGNTN